MKKFLPIAFSPRGKLVGAPIFFPKLLFFFCIIFGLIFTSIPFTPHAFAQAPTPSPVEGTWGPDPDVTFVGKTGARSDAFLKWALEKYEWMTLVEGKNPLIPFWIIIRNIVYAVVALFVLATAFILIITRGQSITVMRFVPRFVFIIVLITLSFSIVQFIYQVSDVVQGFFLRIDPPSPLDSGLITTEDLLYVGFEYETFTGYRIVGPQFEESAFISLLLVRLTAITYYVMTGILLIRKIILWFFVIISPIFPLLLFYRPIRNTAKIWVGEFFRWLLYAPLFAIFLHGLVVMWRTGIPLSFPQIDQGLPGKVENIVYPTAINILLGGPGQALDIYNSVNLRDTFALYVVALLMLWVVILLPFLLLKIFLDYLASLSFDNNVFVKQFMNRNLGFLSPSKGIPPAPPPAPPGMVGPTGMAKSLPFLRKGAGAAVEPIKFHATIQASVRESADIMRLVNLSIPKMRDIARFEASMASRDLSRKNELSTFRNNLSKISNPNLVHTFQEKEKFTTVRQKLLDQKQKGNPIASSILAASQIAEARQKGEAVAKTREQLLETYKEALPQVNKVQQVSLEDYEEVRKLWTENYQTLEPPHDLSGKEVERQEWIKTDIDRVNQAITLLNSPDPAHINEGMEMVGNILPFLLIGGFSKSEVIAYLKAKMEAGKQVLADLGRKEEEEETMLGRQTKKKEEAGTLKATVEEPFDSAGLQTVPGSAQGKPFDSTQGKPEDVDKQS